MTAIDIGQDRQRVVYERYAERIRTARAAGRTLLGYRSLLLLFDLPPLARPADPARRRELSRQGDVDAIARSASDHLHGRTSPLADLWAPVDPELVEEMAGREQVVGRLVAGALADWPRPGRRPMAGFVAELADWGVGPDVARTWVGAQCEAVAAGESMRNSTQRATEHAVDARGFLGAIETHAEPFGDAQRLLSLLGVLAEQHECGGPVGQWLLDPA